jgi:hypothetical protein
MRWAVHLPLVDFGEGGARVGELRDYVRAARELGFDTVNPLHAAAQRCAGTAMWASGRLARGTIICSGGGRGSTGSRRCRRWWSTRPA